ncbi:RebB family R body protein (plasmid) [Candidatus Bealeia paramacronuclearis]|uniref:RebB family R body protein n=1 Tax=Candidatus Bealeia paramacronuclearis TaxID=1921001 RepID=A0ABZ2C879_9PROT|nr:hypothetical protein [Candidatus Bealeia paramacronuclearis]MEB3703406.1 hypothetical protein [Candidatus Bealeia paramacronuclearis]
MARRKSHSKAQQPYQPIHFVIDETPSIALAGQVLAMCHAHALSAYNAVSQQAQNQILSLASVRDAVIQVQKPQERVVIMGNDMTPGHTFQ